MQPTIRGQNKKRKFVYIIEVIEGEDGIKTRLFYSLFKWRIIKNGKKIYIKKTECKKNQFIYWKKKTKILVTKRMKKNMINRYALTINALFILIIYLIVIKDTRQNTRIFTSIYLKKKRKIFNSVVVRHTKKMHLKIKFLQNNLKTKYTYTQDMWTCIMF